MLSSSWLSFYQMIQSLSLLELASPNKTIFYFSSLHLRFYKNFSLILPHLLEIHISTHFQRQHLLSPGSWPLGRYQLSSSLPPQMGPSPSLPADMHAWACTLFLAMTHSSWSAIIVQSEGETLSLSLSLTISNGTLSKWLQQPKPSGSEAGSQDPLLATSTGTRAKVLSHPPLLP